MVRLKDAFSSPKAVKATPKGAAGYDNARENIDPHVKTKSVSTKELTLSDGSAAGVVQNDANGVLSGGHAGGGGGGITNIEGGNSASNFGGVIISPIDGGNST